MTLREAIRLWIAERDIYPAHTIHDYIGRALNSFYLRPDDRISIIDKEPPLTGVQIDDAWVGAVGEHLALRWELPVPQWAMEGRVLSTPYFTWIGRPSDQQIIILVNDSPPAFRRRLIYTEAEPLRKASWRQSERSHLSPSPLPRSVRLDQSEDGS